MRTAPLRVLMGESRFSAAGMTLKSLCATEGYDLALNFVSDLREIGPAMGRWYPNLAILDLSLFQTDPAPQIFQLHKTFPQIPIILLASLADKENAIKCLRFGARDFLLEDFFDDRIFSHVLRAALPMEGEVGLTKANARHGAPLSARLPSSAPRREALTSYNAAFSLTIQFGSQIDFEAVPGGGPAGDLLARLTAGLRKRIRISDSLVLESPGQFVLRFASGGKACLLAIRSRLLVYLTAFQELHLRGTNLELTLHSQFSPANPRGEVFQSLSSRLASKATP